MSQVTWLISRYGGVAKRCNDKESQLILLILHIYNTHHHRRKPTKAFKAYLKTKFEGTSKLKQIWWLLSSKLKHFRTSERFTEAILTDTTIDLALREEFGFAIDIIARTYREYEYGDEIYITSHKRLALTHFKKGMVCRNYEYESGGLR